MSYSLGLKAQRKTLFNQQGLSGTEWPRKAIQQRLNLPSNHAGSDPEALWLRPVMAVTASVQPESGRIVYAGSDFLHPFQFRFSKEAWILLCRTDPDPIWMAWSGFGQTHLVWKQAGVQESSGSISGRTQPARYHFPSFRLGSVLPQTSRILLCNTSPDPI